ncbi:hypothetical protein, conserved [Babesia bigemina]|uniref:C3H1-type domain-containing protein n=1 Tax=Babesia bigemina TaxID=5866 RepID=A0A061BJR4_BABBI|nr:hypothetical protein, conserved [Babesia bigemina]CDR71740.1 hypothetical protein, conserved [Babesia bigemina]|eukprot:XP_012770685.1 hypothetical protein, conserved [Babesia bigemina]
MGFLSGVLSAVKNENEVTTYDTDKSKDINTVIKKLEDNIGSGRTGLAASVDAVRGWLEGYEGEVREMTGNVISNRGTLKQLEDTIQSIISQVESLSRNGFDDAVKVWYKTATKDLSNRLSATETAIDKLDADLKTQLCCYFDRIKLQIDNVKKTASSDQVELGEMKITVETEFGKLRDEVTNYANIRKTICIEDLRIALDTNIQQPIKTVKAKLEEVQNNLERWSTMAVKVVDTAMKKVDEICRELSGSKKIDIQKASQALYEKAFKLRDAIDAVQTATYTHIAAALNTIKDMDEAIRTDLNQVKEAIKVAVNQIKEKVKDLAKEFPKELNGRPTGEQSTTMYDIFEHIRTKVAQIRGERTSFSMGLEGIREAFKDYANEFDKGKFESKVLSKWLEVILDNNILVKGWIKSYAQEVNSKGGRFTSPYDDDELTNKGFIKNVAQRIMQQIEDGTIGAVQAEIRDLSSRADDEIEAYVDAVKRVCDIFADKLDAKLKEDLGKNGAFVEDIARSIDSKFGTYTSVGIVPDPKGHLTWAVDHVLQQLVGAARGATAELHSLSLNKRPITADPGSIAAKITDAHRKVTLLHSQLNTATGQPTKNRKPNHAELLDKAISGVAQALETQLPDGFKHQIDLKNLNAYKKYISQPVDPITQPTGSLPDIIKDIRTDLQDKLGNITDSKGLETINTNKLKSALTVITSAIDTFAKAINDSLTLQGTPIAESPNKNRGVRKLLSDLRKMLDGSGAGSIYNIPQDLKKIQNEIAAIIETSGQPDNFNTLASLVTQAKEFHDKTIPAKINECINNINQKVSQQYQARIKNIKKDTLTRYVRATTEDMRTLSEVIEETRKNMKIMINNDTVSGVKGLLQRLQKYLVTELQDFMITKSIAAPPKTVQNTLQDLAKKLNPCFNLLFQEIMEQPKVMPFSSTFTAVYKTLNLLLQQICDSQHFDYLVTPCLNDFGEALRNIFPDKADDAAKKVLRPVIGGLLKLSAHLRLGYVNSYSGAIPHDTHWIKGDKLSGEGERCCKVFLTALSTLFYELHYLYYHSSTSWSQLKVDGSEDVEDNTGLLKSHLESQGFNVTNLFNRQNSGMDIALALREAFNDKYEFQTFPRPDIDFNIYLKSVIDGDDGSSVLLTLVRHLNEYNEASHLQHNASTKSPCNVYEMLIWFTGLPHSPVYPSSLHGAFSPLFTDINKTDVEDAEIPTIDLNSLSVNAYPHVIRHNDILATLNDVCSQSYEVLVTVLGHGHAGGIYACDYSNNSWKLHYPTNMDILICMMLDYLQRLQYQLQFLYQQCSYETELSGWRECYYGRQVGGSGWQCNELQCPDQLCNQKCKQTCNQIHNQKGDQHPKCGVKSPLQSFLEDGLQGYLPHSVSCKGTKMSCSSCPKTPGMPCRTPMGFGDISVMASHTMIGERIRVVLEGFCGGANSPVTKLCSKLNCLLPSAPKTLGDMFSFYYNFLSGWNHGVRTIFDNAVRSANFERVDSNLDITQIFENSDHSTHIKGDLYSLMKCREASKSLSAYPCGSYMRPLCLNVCNTFTEAYADKYLSWIVYLSETFYDLLRKLYEECYSKCGTERAKCRKNQCNRSCNADRLPKRQSSTHDKSCKSIVQCPLNLPTLYTYGFVYGSSSNLSGAYDLSNKRTCSNLCNALKRVLKQGNVLYILVNDTIPNYLFTIRAPFIWLNVALWLLSLLYLLHIMVIRLDLLHIKSHLHSPSSHRIAAQSLLAAARVDKLNRVFYLQP